MGKYAMVLWTDKHVSVAVSAFEKVCDGRMGRFYLGLDEEIVETVPLRSRKTIPNILRGFLEASEGLEQRIIYGAAEQTMITNDFSIVRYPIELLLYVNIAFDEYFFKKL